MKRIFEPTNFIRHFNFQRWVSRPEGDEVLRLAIEKTLPEGRELLNSWTDYKENGFKQDELTVDGVSTPETITKITSGPMEVDLHVLFKCFTPDTEIGLAVVGDWIIKPVDAGALSFIADWLDENLSIWPYATIEEEDTYTGLCISIDTVGLGIVNTVDCMNHLKVVCKTLDAIVAHINTNSDNCKI